ncbi:Aspartate/methionine/tyrosine aminotransferase [Arboricoccus pini]|uniref:Aminotransferase n=1 Tax=Arboricoccus pini TaxID=1963835 RepID=A0A212QZ31_9PROT|nr:pyridoxal phosphate-dependent aminotransferase [Arboricoccus pini]SNB64989.1 Aspartate/methionine/tyrosine aminotransferase [Arboricoccus pini]
MPSVIRPDIESLGFSGINKIATTALEDPEVIPLWFGESDIVTPDFIRQAASAAMDGGKTFYSYARGQLPLREALLAYHRRVYGLSLDPDRISVPGATMTSVMITCQCLVRPGDEVILVSPYWPNIRTCVQIMGGHPVDVRLEEGPERWSLDLDRVVRAITPRTRAIYVNTPSNPTGWIMSEEEGRALLDLCRKHGLGLISDEVYHRNVFSGAVAAPSFLTLAEPDEPVFILNGFSKAWAMTGWRIGWMVAPRHLAEPIAVLAEVNTTSAPAFVQYGAIAALEQGEPFLQSFIDRCRINRDLVFQTLGAHPRVELLRPEGAFYAFPRIEGVTDSLALATRILAEAKVGLAPGYTFGEGNQAHLRLCFAIRTERMAMAMERLCAVLDQLD